MFDLVFMVVIALFWMTFEGCGTISNHGHIHNIYMLCEVKKYVFHMFMGLNVYYTYGQSSMRK